MTANGSLSPHQTRAITALLAGHTIAEAADYAQVSERTLYRYLSEDDFKAELRAAQDQAIEAAVSALSGAARDAALTLIEIHKDQDVNPAVRVQAARAVLIENLKVREQHELAERVSALEESGRHKTR